jgi:NAD+ kinase
MQFMDREPIYHDHIPPPSSGHGFYEPGEKMVLRWNSRVGTIFLDGAHVTHDVKMARRAVDRSLRCTVQGVGCRV